jgi:mono/diheme cytochrome c family protein
MPSGPSYQYALAGILLGFGASISLADPPAPPPEAFDRTVKPFLAKYCTSCHNSDKNAGGVALDVYTSTAHAKKDMKVWETVRTVMAEGTMPPKKKMPQPAKEETATIVGWIDAAVTKVDCTAPKNPGRVTLRRLNRAEYNNTIRDLCGVDFKPADDFPSDDVGYGFDNIGDVLSLQPILLEKYMSAADKVLHTAIGTLGRVKQENFAHTAQRQNLVANPRSARIREKDAKGRDVRKIVLSEEGAAYIERFNFQADGDYILRVKVWAKASGGEKPKVVLRVDGKDVKTFDAEGAEGKPSTYEVRIPITAGERRISAAFINPAADRSRVLGVEQLDIEGPMGGAAKALPESAKMIFGNDWKPGGDDKVTAEKVLATFTRKAYRRPVKPEELSRLMRLYELAVQQGESFDQAIKLPLKAVLVSPHFLFRVEDDPKGQADAKLLNEFELATRLSYFLWATMPDAELSRLAEKGELRKPGVLEAQVKRMLRDPKAQALVDNFAGQWLMLRSVRTATPDPDMFRDWDESLRDAMIRETETFFRYIVSEDRNVLEFLDADYSFVNDRLARHYGIPNVRGPEFQKVKLPDGRRGGLLTQASVLTVTSNPTRTSPVKRGKWVLENILGTPPPPPAPEVPELPPVGQLKGTLRQQMEQHRSNPNCAGCHAKLDPLGFGLENFNAIGKWRDQDNKQPIDASGVLPGGEKFNGPAQLRKVLLGKADQFRSCLAEKLTTYSLGRGMEYYDKCTIEESVKKLKAGGDKFSALVLAVVESEPFQKRSGKRSE